MSRTKAVEVSIQAVSPALILSAPTSVGSVGAADAAVALSGEAAAALAAAEATDAAEAAEAGASSAQAGGRERIKSALKAQRVRLDIDSNPLGLILTIVFLRFSSF